MNYKSIVFSDTMERKFLSLAMSEGVIDIPESREDVTRKLLSQKVYRRDISQIHANLFLNPKIKIQLFMSLNLSQLLMIYQSKFKKNIRKKKSLMMYHFCAR